MTGPQTDEVRPGTNTNSLRGQIQRMKREDPDNMPESSSTATPRKPKAAAGDGIKTEGGSHGGAAEVEGTPSKKPAKVTGGKRKNAGDANGEVAGGDNNGATPNKTPKKPRKTPTKKTVKQEEMEGQLL